MKIRQLATVLTTCSLILAPWTIPSASAADLYDVKNYPGLGCQAHDGDQEVDLNHVANSSYFVLPSGALQLRGGTWNEATTPRKVTCPIVRDDYANANGTAGNAPGANVGVNVWVNNTGAANALSCTLFSNNQWGIAVAVSNANAPAGISQMNLDVNASVAFVGQYTLQCTLPPNSSVFSYRVFEYLPTDPG